jgi:flagellar biosynthesis protein
MTEPENPRRTAVALEYDRGKDPAPKVVAKGHGLVAERIVALGQEHGVVIEKSPELAEALSHVGLEEKIPAELYRAVAEVIGFVIRTRQKMG